MRRGPAMKNSTPSQCGRASLTLSKLAASLPLLLLAIPLWSSAKKFYADDPLQAEPRPVSVQKVANHKLDAFNDFVENSFTTPGERNKRGAAIPAQAVNTLGEVPDSAWYANRHHKHP